MPISPPPKKKYYFQAPWKLNKIKTLMCVRCVCVLKFWIQTCKIIADLWSSSIFCPMKKITPPYCTGSRASLALSRMWPLTSCLQKDSLVLDFALTGLLDTLYSIQFFPCIPFLFMMIMPGGVSFFLSFLPLALVPGRCSHMYQQQKYCIWPFSVELEYYFFYFKFFCYLGVPPGLNLPATLRGCGPGVGGD